MPTIVLGYKGSTTSGNRMHAGRPGKVGGSMPRNFGQAQPVWDLMKNSAANQVPGYYSAAELNIINTLDITTLNRTGLQAIIDMDAGIIGLTDMFMAIQDPNNLRKSKMAPINPNAPSSAIHHPIQTAKLTGQQIGQQQPGATHDPANQDIDWVDAGLAMSHNNKPGQLYVLESNKWILTVDKTDKTGKQAVADFKAGKITAEQLHEAVAPAYRDRKNGLADVKATDPDKVVDGKLAFHDIYGKYVDGTRSRTEMTGNLADQKWVTQVHLGDLNDNQWEKFSQFKRGLITEEELRSHVAPHTLIAPKPMPKSKAPKSVVPATATTPANYTDPTKLPSYQQLRNGNSTFSNHNGGDTLLDTITHEQGFDGKPQLISKADFHNFVAQGEVAVYRGTSRDPNTRAQRYADFRSGTLFNGYGMYGNGTYTSTSQATARQYANGDAQIMAMTIKKDAKIIEYSDAISKKDNSPYTYTGIGDDVGRWAAANGYDAIVVKSTNYNKPDGKEEDFYVVLNRTALRVVTTDFKKADDTDTYSGW